MKSILLFLFCAISLPVLSQITINLTPVKEHTLYSENASSSERDILISGSSNNGDLRRAILQFDLSAIPSGAIINSVSLSLQVSKFSNKTNGANYYIHHINQKWDEGNSFSFDGKSDGLNTQSQETYGNDARSGSSDWSTRGADFNLKPSASTMITNESLSHSFISNEIRNDVQRWVNGTNANHGWILIGDENLKNNAITFKNKNSNAPAVLKINYTVPSSQDKQTSLANRMTISPNPARDYFIVSIEQNSKPLTLEIYDVLGNKVFHAKRNASSTYNFIPSLPSGIYIVKVHQDDQTATKKLIIK